MNVCVVFKDHANNSIELMHSIAHIVYLTFEIPCVNQITISYLHAKRAEL